MPSSLCPAPVTLPEPIHFTRSLIGDTDMMVAAIPDIQGPFYLPVKAHGKIVNWIQDCGLLSIPDLLAIVGPVKSGKSELLHSVIPGIIAQQFKDEQRLPTKSIFEPVIIKLSCNLGGDPSQFAWDLIAEIHTTVSPFGVMVAIPANPAIALLNLKHVVHRVARDMRAQKKQLYLLLDEMQVCCCC